MKPPTPLVVAGMHRSGTSLAAALLGGRGLDLGQSSPAGPVDDRAQGFEDRGFLALNRRLVADVCDTDLPGYPEWGWTENGRFDAAGLAARADEGRRLLEDLGAHRGHRGFVDPRGTLLLDYWDGLFEEARYVLVYRNPWDVADSMQRLGTEVFLRRPDYAAKMWSFYNRRLLDFYRRQEGRCALVSARALAERPEEVVEVVTRKLGLELGAASVPDAVDGRRLRGVPFGDPWPRLFAATYPGILDDL
ncbi:MAG: sulfotransferase, partial [Acidobacteriota bacterium]